MTEPATRNAQPNLTVPKDIWNFPSETWKT